MMSVFFLKKIKKSSSIAILDWQGTRSLPVSFVHTPTRASWTKKTKPYGFLYLWRQNCWGGTRKITDALILASVFMQNMKFFTQQYSSLTICVFKASSPPSDEMAGSIQLCFFSSFLFSEIHPSLTARSFLVTFFHIKSTPLKSWVPSQQLVNSQLSPFVNIPSKLIPCICCACSGFKEDVCTGGLGNGGFLGGR